MRFHGNRVYANASLYYTFCIHYLSSFRMEETKDEGSGFLRKTIY